MTTSMHIRGGLILWREVLESSSRREGPPRPTRGYSLSRRFGTREIATWTEGLFCEVEADLSSKLERLQIPGLSAIDVLRPFSSTAIPASLQGFLLQVLRPAGPGLAESLFDLHQRCPTGHACRSWYSTAHSGVEQHVCSSRVYHPPDPQRRHVDRRMPRGSLVPDGSARRGIER